MKQVFTRFLLLYLVISFAVWWSWRAIQPTTVAEPTLQVWMLNVGQGESVLVKEPSGKKILFDGGPDSTVLQELGSVLPFWDRTIDLVVLSHNHVDHLRGLLYVLDRYTVKEVWTAGATYNTAEYREWIESLAAHQLEPKTVFAPQSITFGDVSIRVYHPPQSMQGTNPKEPHDANVAIKISYGTEDVLLTGDLHEGHEDAMISACPPPACSLEAEVLQIPHHGSASGLSEEFLAAVSPDIALIPVGRDNEYQHPRANILQDLNEAHVPIYRTDEDGRIYVQLTKDSVVVAE